MSRSKTFYWVELFCEWEGPLNIVEQNAGPWSQKGLERLV